MSDPTTTADPSSATAPIVKELELACSAAHAADVFVERMGEWWPLATHHVTDHPRTVRFPREVGGQVTEVAEDGTEARWGEVLAFDPPDRIAWSWEVTPANPTTQVEVSFTDLGDGRCRVRLEHRGWEAFADEARRAEAKSSYTPGWDACLTPFRALAEGGGT